MSPRTLEGWRSLNTGPAYLKIVGRVIYRLIDIEAYEAKHLQHGHEQGAESSGLHEMSGLIAPRANDLGDWSIGPPPYLRGVDEASFNRKKAEWLGRTMRKSLIPSCRVVAYFIADQLNWATMDLGLPLFYRGASQGRGKDHPTSDRRTGTWIGTFRISGARQPQSSALRSSVWVDSKRGHRRPTYWTFPTIGAGHARPRILLRDPT
jgi:hypothetical protein